MRADGRVEATAASEAVMLGAVIFGHQQMQIAIKAINELAVASGTIAETSSFSCALSISVIYKDG